MALAAVEIFHGVQQATQNDIPFHSEPSFFRMSENNSTR